MIRLAGNVIDRTGFEPFTYVSERPAGIVDVRRGAMVIKEDRVGQIVERAIDKLTHDTAVLAVWLARSVGIKEPHDYGVGAVSCDRIPDLQLIHPFRDCIVI